MEHAEMEGGEFCIKVEGALPIPREVTKVADVRAKLRKLGPRPDAVEVEEARKAIANIEACLKDQLANISAAPCPPGEDIENWSADQVQALQNSAAKAKEPYEALIEVDELHIKYEEELKQAEFALEGIEDSPVEVPAEVVEKTDNDVSLKLQEALEGQLDSLNLSGQFLVHLPESFGRITSLVSLNLSNNSLELIPDSIAGLVNLERLDLQHNQLKALPDSIGLLKNLKSIDVSKNLLRVFPASLGHCSALVELIANFNQVELWPSDFGFQMINLQTLCLQLNKITSLPPSIGELQSLRVLDVHFNKLRGLPATIGNLTNLALLDVSSNFHDFVALPDSIGDLVSLTELNLSFNQIHELPLSMGRLTNLTKLKLDENPLVVPPLEVVEQGFDAVIAYMAMLWTESLKPENEKSFSRSATFPGASQPPDAAEGWLPVVNNWLSKVQIGGVSSIFGGNAWLRSPTSQPKKPKATDDSYLEQQL